MSRPRRAFGSTRPGQLTATRLKVVAAELADPSRLTRGRRYARDGSVVDITVDELAVAAIVVGSRSEPYLVELGVARGDGPPLRQELTALCSCPDAEPGHPSYPAPVATEPDAGTASAAWRTRAGGGQGPGEWCKHAIAALLVLADEIAIEPELLDRWRGTAAPADAAPADASPGAHGAPGGELVTVNDGTGPEHDTSVGEPDLLAAQLSVPAGASVPLIPDVEPLERPLVIGDELLSRWVTEMHSLLRQQR